jgi:uncharacterized protein YecT (DUF1311 family)
MLRWVYLVCLIVGSDVIAEERADCSEAITQLEMNECAEADFELADRELNRIYNAILTSHRKDVGFVKRLRAAQRAWIAFRDAELEAAFFCESGNYCDCFGSMAPMSFSALKTKMTRAPTEQLQSMTPGRYCQGCG